MAHSLPVDINRLRRRPPGGRALVYLDQSALSAFAREPRLAETLSFVRSVVEDGRAICLQSHEHTDETLLAPKDLWDTIDRLADELSVGINFLPRDEIEWHEIHAAASEFLGQPFPPDGIWKEAFQQDPHIDRGSLFFNFRGSAIRVRARFDPADWEVQEVEHEKAKEEPMTAVYGELREKGFSFEVMAESNLTEMIRWKLGPLVDPGHHAAQVAKRYAEWAATADAEDPDITAGSPWSRLNAFATRTTQIKYLVKRFPALEARAAEFGASPELRHAPTMAFPALLRAALAATPGRKAKPGDGYDIQHLTRGLSRCDVITADSGMAHLCRSYGLVPTGCTLLGARELDQLQHAIEGAILATGG